VLRLLAKYRMNEQAGDGIGGLLMQVGTLITDRADDRSWVTLPEDLQVADAFLPAGTRTLSCNYRGMSTPVTLDIQPGRTHYVIVTQLDRNLLVQSADIVSDTPAAPAAAVK
jgi:hypothetical protein